ncbi:cobalamin-binding protein [Planctomyces sp. SH-PL62]|uniref:cobalamin-binding protein n=1 Tax=Planctomyces sp. SH-PL62 TaxID=1636152 RepID=UPI00078EE0FD|nr:cobalamin-binding protein [Planctomyces sp. SH-PL62]AMV36364.1 Vitamin B12-binding protein [Planctomyces sp. SH-PL62]
MRIVSLLPSLTELVHSLGRGGDLVGVTHECDYPTGVEALPWLTRSRIPTAASSAQIDALVASEQGGLYTLDEAKLAEVAPDLILTQEQCDVCAVNEAVVRRSAMKLPSPPHVESVDPRSLDGVFAMFRRVGELLDRRDEAEALVAGFAETTRAIASRLDPARPKPRVLLLEWIDPPYGSGHWNPEIIARAGGVEVIGRAGERSRRVAWEEVAAAEPDVILVSLCGFPLGRAEFELQAVVELPEWRGLPAVRDGRVAVVDGSAYFSRPGPRLETSLRIAAAAIHPTLCRDLAPPEGDGWWFLAPRP